MATATPYKVHVKLGQAEFSAEGPEETVKKQLADFLEVVPIYADQPGRSNGHANGHATGTAANGNGHATSEEHSTAPTSPTWRTQLEPALLKRLFTEDKDGLVSLRVLPNGTEDKVGDALFLILFGFLVLKDQSEVMASDLLTAARQSGVSLSRIDHALEKYGCLVTKGGARRGSRYALTNPGIEYAEDVALKMFG